MSYMYLSICVLVIMYSLPDPPRLEGPLKPNGHLLLAEALYEGRLVGPESIALDRGMLKLCSFLLVSFLCLLRRLLTIAFLYLSQTCDQKCFAVSEVAADWHELIILQCTMQLSFARISKHLDPLP